MLNGWGIYRPQPSLNLELKTVNSRNSGIRRLHLLTGAVAPLGRARRLSLWVVLPPVRGGCTSCQSSKTELRRLHLLAELEDRAQAVLPPVRGGCTAQSRSETEPQAVPPPGWSGCTSQSRSETEPRRCNLLPWAVQPPGRNQGPNGLIHSAQFGFFRGPIAPRLS